MYFILISVFYVLLEKLNFCQFILWKSKVINVADHWDVCRLSGANDFKLLVTFRDTTDWPQCHTLLQLHLAVRAQAVNLESVAPGLRMCHKVTSKYAVYRNLAKLNYLVVCILWYMKNFKKHGRANWKPISWVKVKYFLYIPPVPAKLESHAMWCFLFILWGNDF